MTTFSAADLRHDEKGHRFFFEDEQGRVISYLDYRLQRHLEPQQIIFHYVFTPPELRNRGIARKLSNLAFDYAFAKGLDILPTCPYVRTYFMRWKSGRVG